MSILKDLDPNYEKNQVSNQGGNNWKVIALALSVATIAFIGWTAIQNLVASKPDNISASTLPITAAMSKENAESPVAQPETKGAVIDEQKPAPSSQNIETANDAVAQRSVQANHISSPPTIDAPQEQALKNIREEKETMTKSKSSKAPQTRRTEKALSVAEKTTTDRDVAIIRSLVK